MKQLKALGSQWGKDIPGFNPCFVIFNLVKNFGSTKKTTSPKRFYLYLFKLCLPVYKYPYWRPCPPLPWPSQRVWVILFFFSFILSFFFSFLSLYSSFSSQKKLTFTAVGKTLAAGAATSMVPKYHWKISQLWTAQFLLRRFCGAHIYFFGQNSVNLTN